MDYLLDTNILIETEENNLKIINTIDQYKCLSGENLFISFFSFAEFYYGLLRKKPKNRELLIERLNSYGLINTTKKTGMIFCEILSYLKDKGKLIPYFDIFIAAMAIENNLTLITLDEHFKWVPGLKVIVLKN